MMLNKKGLSGVIVALIMIVIVLAAIAIFWGVFSDIFEKGTEDVENSGACTGINLDIKSADCDEDTGICDITIERNAGGGDFDGIQYSLSNETDNRLNETDTELTASQRKTVSIGGLDTVDATELIIRPYIYTDDGKYICPNEDKFSNIQ